MTEEYKPEVQCAGGGWLSHPNLKGLHAEKSLSRPAQLRFRGGRPCPTPAPLPPPPSRAAPQAAPPPARPSPVPCPRAAPSPGAVRCGAVRPEEGSGRLGPGSRGRWVLCAAWFPRRLPEILLFRWFLDADQSHLSQPVI